jgi:hypothetical protein
LSTGSPFLSLISVKKSHFLSALARACMVRALKWSDTMLVGARDVNRQIQIRQAAQGPFMKGF